MKKIWNILSFFLIFGFVVCLILGFTSKIPVAVSKSSSFLYKLFTGIQYFLVYLPVLMITGFVVSCSVHFGHNCEGSTSRFSAAMAERYKGIMIISFIIAFVLTFSTEFLDVFINQKKNAIVNQPKLINDYIKVGNNLFENGYYERAMRYADAALKLDSNSKGAAELKANADIEENRAKTTNLRFKLYESVEEAEKVDRVIIDAKQINEVYRFYLQAQDCFDKKEWFNAHYYSQLGINLATPKDPNLEALKKISTASWNNLVECHDLAKTEGQQAFEKKYQGYLALVEKDDLKAYYIFRELYNSSREFQSDPDVVFYLQIAENRINEKYFFIDETLELESFENANDVYFSYKYADGSKDIIYFKGMTTVEETGNAIQYLRELTIKSVNKDGDLLRTMTVPYAKVLPVSVKTLTPTTKALMGIGDDIENVPYLMLKSVGREKPNTEISPVYTYESGETANSPEYMLLSIPFEDFVMLENIVNNTNAISILSLFRLVFKSSDYGFASEIYGQTLINRLLYPLFIIIIFVLLAMFAWNNRIGMNQFFKFSWAFAFPIFFVVAGLFYQAAMFVFKLTNYVILGGFGISTGLIIGVAWNAFLLILVSVTFMSKNSRV